MPEQARGHSRRVAVACDSNWAFAHPAGRKWHCGGRRSDLGQLTPRRQPRLSCRRFAPHHGRAPGIFEPPNAHSVGPTGAEQPIALDQLVSQVATIDGVTAVGTTPSRLHGAGARWLHSHGHGHHMDGHGHGTGTRGAQSEDSDGASMWHLAALRMGGAWQLQNTAAPKVVAMLDTGLSTDSNGVPLAPGWRKPASAGLRLREPRRRSDRRQWPRTLLAGVIGAKGEFPGVAPGVTLLPVKVLDASAKATKRRWSKALLRGGARRQRHLHEPRVPDWLHAVAGSGQGGAGRQRGRRRRRGCQRQPWQGRGVVPRCFRRGHRGRRRTMGKPFKAVSLDCALDKHSEWVASKVVRRVLGFERRSMYVRLAARWSTT